MIPIVGDFNPDQMLLDNVAKNVSLIQNINMQNIILKMSKHKS